MRMLPIFVSAIFMATGANAKAGAVDDPEKCEAQWEIRLEQHRNTVSRNVGWPEQLILDANQGGDFKMAQRYMERFGWYAMANESPDDLSLHFMPDTQPVISYSPRHRQRVAANPAEGLKRACYAAWISGVPFVRVTKRGTDGTSVWYSVTTENMPVKEF